ncbi:twin-arginine translocase TatA/TatE family subunit [Paenibacillus sp. GCM10027626]|uniref:twin-arginine translocase TatA/TatE family subunit n=1 Tax=Paenibacillus sp. GCM10027626 TaxID=3273411 RepID=UPI00363CC779
MAGIGVTGMILIVLVALILFGPSKQPELGRAFGTSIPELRLRRQSRYWRNTATGK